MTTIVHHHDHHSRILQQSNVKNSDLKTHLIPKFKDKMEGTQMHFEAKSRGSLLLIANTNKFLNCGYRSNLTHSWILKHFGVENNHFKTHLAQELNKKWKAHKCNLKHKLGYGFGEILMIVKHKHNLKLC
jgi:hypothetical protein